MDLKSGRMVLYRGSLKSCNYRCSYCPFSKHPRSDRELLKDKQQWQQFCQSLADRAEKLNIRAVMVVPYGEALIHPWYWEGLGSLGAMMCMDEVGAQTNCSFPLERSLKLYERAGGKMRKLRLWATFHPEMTTPEEFGDKCRKLQKAGAAISAGAVGAVENLDIIKKLRRELPEEIYLWINKMDGLKRKYAKEEQTAFEQIDPYFMRELELVPADPSMCRNRLFVEGDGKLRRCNISRILPENWYDGWKTVFDEPKEIRDLKCGKRACSCYLAYGGRDEVMNRVLFGNHPLFRIPGKPKAVFLDIDKTLIPEGETCIPGRTVTDIQALVNHGCRLFFATSLPLAAAKHKCREVWNLFAGGIFAGGAHVVLQADEERRERFLPVGGELLLQLERLKRKYRFRILTYENFGIIYKITLVRPKHMGWEREAAALEKEWSEAADENQVRSFAEDNCLQIVNAEASKAGGVKLICRWLGITPGEAAAAGDSEEDKAMMELCLSSGTAACIGGIPAASVSTQ